MLHAQSLGLTFNRVNAQDTMAIKNNANEEEEGKERMKTDASRLPAKLMGDRYKEWTKKGTKGLEKRRRRAEFSSSIVYFQALKWTTSNNVSISFHFHPFHWMINGPLLNLPLALRSPASVRALSPCHLSLCEALVIQP